MPCSSPVDWATRVDARPEVYGTLVKLACCADEHGRVEMALKNLCDVLKSSEATTRRLVAYLSAVGVLVRETAHGGRSAVQRLRLEVEMDSAEVSRRLAERPAVTRALPNQKRAGTNPIKNARVGPNPGKNDRVANTARANPIKNDRVDTTAASATQSANPIKNDRVAPSLDSPRSTNLQEIPELVNVLTSRVALAPPPLYPPSPTPPPVAPSTNGSKPPPPEKPPEKPPRQRASWLRPMLTDAERSELHQRWDHAFAEQSVEVDEEITLALDHPAAKKYQHVKLYVSNWLRNSANRRAARVYPSRVNGSSSYATNWRQRESEPDGFLTAVKNFEESL